MSPLMAQLVPDPSVEEQAELDRVDALFHRKFGDDRHWKPGARHAFTTTVQSIHRCYGPKEAA